MSPMFEPLKARYEKDFVRIDQLAGYVYYGRLTEDEYKLITGEDYPTA